MSPQLIKAFPSAMIPRFDGDGFFYMTTQTEAGSGLHSNVFMQAIEQFLLKIGFHTPKTRFRLLNSHQAGRELPVVDLRTLAAITCSEQRARNSRAAESLCAALTGDHALASPSVDAFARIRMGMDVREFRASLERAEVEYFFTQEREVKAKEHPNVSDIPDKVPLEHVGIRVEARKGSAGLFVSGRVINADDDTTVTNVITIRAEEAIGFARKALAKVKGIESVSDNPVSPVELLLLPYGKTAESSLRPALKYVYRMALVADFSGKTGTFYLWLDAQTGEILELVPTMGSATAKGKTFVRDPSSLPNTGMSEFDVDVTTTEKFILSRSGIFTRLNKGPDSAYSNEELEKGLADFTPPAIDQSHAPFERSPMGDIGADPIKNVACATGFNKDFAQIDLMATISRYRETFNSAGPVLYEFPLTEQEVYFDWPGCSADHANNKFYFGVCSGYTALDCPDTGYLNPAHDHTVVAHEFGHAFTAYQYGYPPVPSSTPSPGNRGSDWCLGNTTLEDGTASTPCPKPISSDGTFHEFADAWAHMFEDTNCFGGWFAKNNGGTDVSKDCLGSTSELDGWPRLADAIQDHFPEHRTRAADMLTSSDGWVMAYSDMQIAAAALWSVRQGLKSREPVLGELTYIKRFVRTLATTGWFGTAALAQERKERKEGSPLIYIDRDIYRYLVELEVKLAKHWTGMSGPGESTVNKVASGFARAGIFMIPWVCLELNPTTSCTTGADAVIDVEPGHDIRDRSLPPPTFHIWTGPRYRFEEVNPMSGAPPGAPPLVTGGAAVMSPSPPCNTQFEVELSNDRTFPSGSRKLSTPASGVWRTVGTDCHATWQPDATDWTDLLAASGDTVVYYGVTTRKSPGVDVRVSTSPARGLFGVFDPPNVVVNDVIIPPPPPVLTPAKDKIPPLVPSGLEVEIR